LDEMCQSLFLPDFGSTALLHRIRVTVLVIFHWPSFPQAVVACYNDNQDFTALGKTLWGIPGYSLSLTYRMPCGSL
jgi:hypothetical protein